MRLGSIVEVGVGVSAVVFRAVAGVLEPVAEKAAKDKSVSGIEGCQWRGLRAVLIPRCALDHMKLASLRVED